MLYSPLILLALLPLQAGGATRSPQGSSPSQVHATVGSVRADVHGNGRATITWRTLEPTTGWIRYGRGTGLSATAKDPVVRRQHFVELDGLAPRADYGFVILSEGSDGELQQTSRQSFRSGGVVTGAGFEVSGRMQPWFPLTISFDGPFATELDASPNPFLDYRLEVEFTSPGGKTVRVPGFFDGDGQGEGSGRTWSARLAPNQPGTWSFVAHFRKGTDVAIDLSPTAGTPTSFDGTRGTFEVLPQAPGAPGLYRHGKLLYVNRHYLRFADGSYFIKGGSNSPENLLAFAGINNTFDQGGLSTSGLTNGLHHYRPHRKDWGPPELGGLGSYADPLFGSRDSGIDSIGIAGAINYLASVHVNSLYVMPMNLGGDGQEVCPFVGYQNTSFDKTHYDVSKLSQWEEIFEHVARRGMLVQLVLAEFEQPNRNWLDGGTLGRERKLFYRELIARFGHLPAIKWNLSEECVYTTAQVEAFAGYIQALDPYQHPIGFHVNLLPVSGASQQYTDVLGDTRFSTNSLQAIPYTASDLVEKWRKDSAAAGRKWVVEFDEQLQALTDTNAAELRKKELYDTLFSGAHIEWYAGYLPLPLGGDLRMEDFRTREEMWNYTWYARKVLQENVPFWLMSPADDLVSGETQSFGGAEVLALPGYYYAIYYPEATATGTLDFGPKRRRYTARWYNPRTGQYEGKAVTFRASGKVPVVGPPSQPGEDWGLIVGR